MAEISKIGIPSVASPLGGTGPDQTVGLTAGAALGAHDACYVNADGKVYPATGAAANAAANVHGYAAKAYPIGARNVCLQHGGFNSAYGSGLTPGTTVFLSGTVAGGIADAASAGGTKKLGFVVDATRVRFYSVSGS